MQYIFQIDFSLALRDFYEYSFKSFFFTQQKLSPRK